MPVTAAARALWTGINRHLLDNRFGARQHVHAARSEPLGRELGQKPGSEGQLRDCLLPE